MESRQKKYVEASINANLNLDITFNNFVVGTSNRLAEAVAQSVVSDMRKGKELNIQSCFFLEGQE
jgi:chromosomal replication initiation ATPase DnaA